MIGDLVLGHEFQSLPPQMTPSNVAVPNCMASTPRIRKSIESLNDPEILKLFRPFCECGRLSQLTPTLVTTIGVDATVQLYKPTATSPYSSKLHITRETANYIQLAQHTQPYWPASDLPKSAQVSTVSLYHLSFLLTTPPLYLLLSLLHQVTPPPLLPLLPLKDPYLCRQGNPTQVPYYYVVKDQGAEPNCRSYSSIRKNHYIESPEVNRSTAKSQERSVPGTLCFAIHMFMYTLLI